jgi:hypothetical protein
LLLVVVFYFFFSERRVAVAFISHGDGTIISATLHS